MVLNGHPDFVWQPASVSQLQGMLPQAQPLQPDSLAPGFTSLCRLVLYHVRVTCVQIRYQDCKTSHGFKGIPVIDAPPPSCYTPHGRSDVLCADEEQRFQTQICQLVVLRPLLCSGKVCQREFFHHPSLWCWLYEASGADKLTNTLIISA